MTGNELSEQAVRDLEYILSVASEVFASRDAILLVNGPAGLKVNGRIKPNARLHCRRCRKTVGQVQDYCHVLAQNLCEHCGRPFFDEPRIRDAALGLYRERVRKITYIARKHFIHEIEGYERLKKNGFIQEGYHLDHRFSVAKALDNRVSELKIGHPGNLCVLSSKENIGKNARCSISIEELDLMYSQFVEHHSDWEDLALIFLRRPCFY